MATLLYFQCFPSIFPTRQAWSCCTTDRCRHEVACCRGWSRPHGACIDGKGWWMCEKWLIPRYHHEKYIQPDIYCRSIIADCGYCGVKFCMQHSGLNPIFQLNKATMFAPACQLSGALAQQLQAPQWNQSCNGQQSYSHGALGGWWRLLPQLLSKCLVFCIGSNGS